MNFFKSVFLFCFLTQALSGQQEQLIFEHLTQKDGLSQSSVFSIFQDKQGFMWFGTRDGLNRYDGYRFKVFQHKEDDTFSISSNEIKSIADDTLGNLWIGTVGGGLSIFNPYYERFYNNIAFGTTSSPTQKMVNTIFRDSKGQMWIATRAGLYLATANNTYEKNFSITLTEISEITGNENYRGLVVRHINEVSTDYLLLATDHGCYVFNCKEKTLRLIDIEGASNYIYTSSFKENENTYWLGLFDYGIIKVQFNNKDFERIVKTERFNVESTGYNNLPNTRVEAMAADKNNNLWVSSRSGLICFNIKNKTKNVYKTDPLNPRSISDNRNNSIFIDRTGMLWIGSEYQGINKVNLNSKPFFLLRNIPGNSNSLINNYVSSISGSKESTVYIGTDGSGFDKLTIGENMKYKFSHFNSSTLPLLTENQVISLLQDKDGIVWIGSGINSLKEFNPVTQNLKYHSNPGHIFSLYRGNNDYLWIGTWIHGLYRYNVKKGSFDQFIHNNKPNSLSIDIVLSVLEDKNKVLWIGTKGGGLNRLDNVDVDPSAAVFSIYKHNPDSSNTLSNNDVNCIMQASDNTIWVCTADGLNKIIQDANKNITFKVYLQKDGLPNSFVYGALEDKKGNLWLSTNKGISKFNPNTEEFKNYDQNDGLQSDEFRHNAYFKDTKGNMFFGGNNGLNIFMPDSIKEDTIAPIVVITDIKIPGIEEKDLSQHFGKSLSYINEIELKSKDKEITIEFAALHYAVPQKNQYKYRLKGFNNEWHTISSQKRSATYTNLDWGEYTFQVKASNNDGVWNQKPLELKIKVLPPPWRTIWAYILYVIIIGSALLIFRNYSLIAVKEKNKLVIEHLEREKLEELSKLKIQFFTNISHELRTPLTLINSPLEELLAKDGLDDDSKQQLSLMQRNVNRLLQMINQLLDFRKIDSGKLKLSVAEVNLIDVINEVYQSFIQHAETRKIKLHFMAFQEAAFLWVDKEKMRTVFYNLLSNAFKYSPDGSAIIVETNVREKEFKPRGKQKKLMHSKSGKKTPFLEIKIIDTGIGIEKHQIKKIFDRFYQASEKAIQFGGSGIGLAISREYVEMHGGNIEVESTIDKGSCFTISLPFGRDHYNNEVVSFEEVGTKKEIEEISPAPDNVITDKTRSGKDEKALLLFVEDNQELVEYMTNKLHEQYRIDFAPNGLKGIESAIDRNPDLIITDLMMPEMDGIEMCRKLKTDIQTSHIPIIILTAKSTEESTIEGLETGADVYIPKPFSVNVLKAQIKTLLDSRQKQKNNFNRQLVLQPKEVSVTSIDERFMKKLLEVVEANIADPNFGIKEMTAQMNMSHSVLFRKIKSLTGLNVVEFVRSFRLKKAALILSKKKIPISEVSFMTGFSDPKYFSKCFQKEFGMTPSDYANKQERE